ncbi:putative immunoglobulin-blocking virulence protein [Ureaplasma sp. ES3154-GEN]|uniref:putative immunoglobulin-blocking virulence protein n=1 Tax=Ureaplasma sp. ES3154-GEN TaxID=2984844 RepID=UPI0021E722B0|nr:putative immunoglobulin-blocking virulence protein [Ureaplasma sp. ES3154-GEN]MCV3743576.1 putative immunoglobulin-blocking virulence protein [Ureaplasma sp. ES3154-GEN]
MKLKQKLILTVFSSTIVVASIIALTLGLKKHSSPNPNSTSVHTGSFSTSGVNVSKTATPKLTNPLENKIPKNKEHIEKEEIIKDKLEVEESKNIEVPKQPTPTPEVSATIETPKKPQPEPEKQKEPDHIQTQEDPYIDKTIRESEQPKDLQVLPKEVHTKVHVDGLDEDIVLQPQPNRIYFRSDEKAGITNQNPDPYLAERVPDVVSFNPSNKFLNKQVEKSIKFIGERIFNPLLDSREQIDKWTTEDYKNYISTMGHEGDEIARWNPKLKDSDKFSRIIHNSDVWKKFLRDDVTPQKIAELEALPEDESPQTLKSVTRILKIASYLDFNKLNKLSPEAETIIRAGGFTLDESNAYLNEKGEWASYAYTPVPGTNKVTSRLEYDNANRRVFGYDSAFNRNPEDLENGSYPGWTKTINTELTNKYNPNNIQGITFNTLTRDEPKTDKPNKGVTLTIDVAKQEAYNNTVNLLEKLKKDQVKIDGFRFTNIGLSSATQRFIQIIQALPEEIDQLELFFIKKDTTALYALKDKKRIKELGLYTNELPYDDEWRINPWSVKNVWWINTNDYNTRIDHVAGYKPFTRIMFDTLIFYNDDIDNNATNLEDKLNHINYGLRMAYFVRNNEPFFNGSMGGGLKPDHNEGGNSYPWGLDLSRTSLKSLRGLLFSDEKKKNNGTRKLKYLWLKNQSSVFEITTDEINNSQFKDIMIIENYPRQMPKTKIFFSNNSQTKYLRIVQGSEPLNSNGIANIQWLKKLADSEDFKNNPVLVDFDNTQLRDMLSNYFSVKQDQKEEVVDVA